MTNKETIKKAIFAISCILLLLNGSSLKASDLTAYTVNENGTFVVALLQSFAALATFLTGIFLIVRIVLRRAGNWKGGYSVGRADACRDDNQYLRKSA